MNIEELEDTEHEEDHDFEVEEVRSSDIEPDSDGEPLEVRRPDLVEDVESVYSHTSSRRSGMPSQLDPSVVEALRDLDCSAPIEDTSDQKACDPDQVAFLERRKSTRDAKKKRWSINSLKRGIEQSLGSGSDEEDRDVRREDAMEVVDESDGNQRRLRRKIGDRMSLSPDDMPPSIAEEANEGNEEQEVKAEDGGNEKAEAMDIDDDA